MLRMNQKYVPDVFIQVLVDVWSYYGKIKPAIMASALREWNMRPEGQAKKLFVNSICYSKNKHMRHADQKTKQLQEAIKSSSALTEMIVSLDNCISTHWLHQQCGDNMLPHQHPPTQGKYFESTGKSVLGRQHHRWHVEHAMSLKYKVSSTESKDAIFC